MGFGVNVGIDANADRRDPAICARDFAQHFQFGFALHVEAADAHIQCTAHFGAGLADAGKDDVPGLAARRQHALEFAA